MIIAQWPTHRTESAADEALHAIDIAPALLAVVCLRVLPMPWIAIASTRVGCGTRRVALSFVMLLFGFACVRASTSVSDVDGVRVDPLAGSGALTVLTFVSTECPISNRYAPEIRRIAQFFAGRGVRFFLVYPNRADGAAKVRRHVAEFDYGMPALIDSEHVLVRLAGAEVTPEVAVFRRDRSLVYAGRIDDRYVTFGSTRPQPRRHDLEAAIEAGLLGRAVRPARSAAVGCAIDD